VRERRQAPENFYIHRDPGPQARLRHNIAAYVPGGRPLLADPAGVAAFQQDTSPHVHQLCRHLACTFAWSPFCGQPA
jgi:hypothetical protein